MNKKKYLTLKEIQKEETNMLKELVTFLDNNHIEYFIAAGTFLGAVRHKGFIPWDDDIDIAIKRPEYNKLINIIKKNDCKLSDNLEFIGYDLGNSDYPILKLINKSINVDEEDKYDKYLWVDIFVLDGVLTENDTKYYKKCTKLHTILYLKRKLINKEPIPSSNIITKISKFFLLQILKMISYEKLLKFYFNYCTKYDYDKCNYLKNNICTDSSLALEKKDFISCKYTFEGIEVNGIKDYDKYLTQLYGKNYMELPPEEKRITHSFKAWKK